MTPFVAALTRPSGLDPRAPLNAESALRFRESWERCAIVDPAQARVDTCWKRPPPGPVVQDFVLVLGDKSEDVIYLIGGFAIRGNDVRLATAEFVQLLASLPLALTIARARLPQERVPRCEHRGHVPSILPCACGVPEDFERWASAEVCLFSNCYNFAVRDFWCNEGFGAQPTDTPDDLTDADAWADILWPDGLRHVPDFPDVPADIATPDGWHVALAVNEQDGNYHFLRLDGDDWTHKFGKRPPQACDASGSGMPKDDLEQADLFDYHVVTYFWAPRPLRINH
jgi:hypothetical protein